MSSSDQSSGAGSGDLNVPEKSDSVIHEVLESLKKAKEFISQNKPSNSDSNSGNNNGNSGNNGSSQYSQDDYQKMENRVEKLRKDLIYISGSFKNLKAFENRAGELLEALKQRSSFGDLKTGGSNVSTQARQLRSKLGPMDKIVIELKLRIPLPHKLSSDESGAHRNTQGGTDFDDAEVVNDLPVLHVDKGFTNSLAFRDFRLVYESLDPRTKMCLLCFAIIPENEIVKKRFMTYWWVGEEFVQVEKADDEHSEELSVEEVANKIFEQLEKNDCIEPVKEKRRFVVDSYKMNSFIRSAVIVLAKEAGFFDFDDEGTQGRPSAKWKSSYRACLVDRFNYEELFKSNSESKSKNEVKRGTGSDAERTGPGLDAEKQESKSKNEVKSGTGSDAEGTGSGLEAEKLESKSKNDQVKSGTGSDAVGTGPGLEAEKLRGIFNVNEPYPDVFELGWFSKLKNVKVLYLGRWQTSDKHHIEVESVEFLKGLKSLKRLRFFSLQGVSRIAKLPDSVCDLLNLRILDLRACHGLEELPNGIESLKELTHLDISECYLLENMPKGIGSLSKLQVLKGFVISDNSRSKSCTLDALSKLTNLGKLSIYTHKEAFPEDADVTTLLKFGALRKLTITWGAGAFTTKEDSQVKQDDGAASAICIECFPKAFPKLSTFKNATSAICIKCFPKPFPKLSSFKNAAEPGPKETPEQMEASTTLEKLDLKCYPRMEAPSWLRPGNFPKLEKLYIRGGNLQNLSPSEENGKWKVNILRLKFLSNLKMDWKELLSSFPDMICLEKYKCPKLTFFPCNENEIGLQPRTEAGRNAAEKYNIVH